MKENLCAIDKKRLVEEKVTWKTSDKTAFRVWDQTSPEVVIKLLNSLPIPLNNFVKSEGTVIGC